MIMEIDNEVNKNKRSSREIISELFGINGLEELTNFEKELVGHVRERYKIEGEGLKILDNFKNESSGIFEHIENFGYDRQASLAESEEDSSPSRNFQEKLSELNTKGPVQLPLVDNFDIFVPNNILKPKFKKYLGYKRKPGYFSIMLNSPAKTEMVDLLQKMCEFDYRNLTAIEFIARNISISEQIIKEYWVKHREKNLSDIKVRISMLELEEFFVFISDSSEDVMMLHSKFKEEFPLTGLLNPVDKGTFSFLVMVVIAIVWNDFFIFSLAAPIHLLMHRNFHYKDPVQDMNLFLRVFLNKKNEENGLKALLNLQLKSELLVKGSKIFSDDSTLRLAKEIEDATRTAFIRRIDRKFDVSIISALMAVENQKFPLSKLDDKILEKFFSMPEYLMLKDIMQIELNMWTNPISLETLIGRGESISLIETTIKLTHEAIFSESMDVCLFNPSDYSDSFDLLLQKDHHKYYSRLFIKRTTSRKEKFVQIDIGRSTNGIIGTGIENFDYSYPIEAIYQKSNDLGLNSLDKMIDTLSFSANDYKFSLIESELAGEQNIQKFALFLKGIGIDFNVSYSEGLVRMTEEMLSAIVKLDSVKNEISNEMQTDIERIRNNYIESALQSINLSSSEIFFDVNSERIELSDYSRFEKPMMFSTLDPKLAIINFFYGKDMAYIEGKHQEENTHMAEVKQSALIRPMNNFMFGKFLGKQRLINFDFDDEEKTSFKVNLGVFSILNMKFKFSQSYHLDIGRVESQERNWAWLRTFMKIESAWTKASYILADKTEEEIEALVEKEILEQTGRIFSKLLENMFNEPIALKFTTEVRKRVWNQLIKNPKFLVLCENSLFKTALYKYLDFISYCILSSEFMILPDHILLSMIRSVFNSSIILGKRFN